jgi:hypothetical protein
MRTGKRTAMGPPISNSAMLSVSNFVMIHRLVATPAGVHGFLVWGAQFSAILLRAAKRTVAREEVHALGPAVDTRLTLANKREEHAAGFVNVGPEFVAHQKYSQSP